MESVIKQGTQALIQAHCEGELPRLSAALPRHWSARMRSRLEDIVNIACSKRPSDRFASAATMRKALKQALRPQTC